MSEFEDDIWRMFAQETEEHLEAIESLLLAAEAGNLAEGDIAVLFRSFHSIKGLCRAMDLIGMESVSHLAEDLLGLAREGACPLDSAMAALLIEAQDALMVLRSATLEGAGAGEAPPELMAKLSAMHARLTGAAPTPAAPAASIPAVAANTVPEAACSGSEVPAAACGTSCCGVQCADCTGCLPQGARLHEDAEMLRFYTDLLKQNLPAVGKVLSDECVPGSEPCASCDGCHNLDAALDSLALASDAMNFGNISEALAGLQRIKIAGTSLDAATREHFLAAAPGLLSLLHHVDSETDGDSGVKNLASNMSASVHAVLDGELFGIGRDLDDLENTDGRLSIDDEAVAESLFGKLARAASYFAFLCPQHQSPLLLLLEDVFARAARRELQIYGELIEITRDSLAVIDRVHALLRAGNPVDSDLVQRETALASRIHDYTWSNSAGDSPLTAIKDFVTGLNIDAELTEILTPENVRDLMEGVRKGEMIYEILAHLESDEQLAVAFLEWIEKRGRVITNRTVFIEGRTWYEMLFLSGAARDEMAAEITSIDNQRNLVRLRLAEGDATTATSTVTAGTPPA
ncbi:MAG: Hpt domain-containing protein, partial [Rhodocyclaceae bacterium]